MQRIAILTRLHARLPVHDRPLRSSPEHVFGGVGAHPRWYRCTRTTLRVQLREAVCTGEDVVQVRSRTVPYVTLSLNALE